MAKAKKAELDMEDMPEIIHPKKKNKTGPGSTITLDEEHYRQIQVMSGIGMRMGDISLVLGFSESTLYNLCDRDDRILLAIKSGKAKAISAVTQTAFQLAKGGKHPAMTMFWLKCQQRWREVHPEDQKQVHEVVFKTKIGDKGQIMSEQIEGGKSGGELKERDKY